MSVRISGNLLEVCVNGFAAAYRLECTTPRRAFYMAYEDARAQASGVRPAWKRRRAS